MSDQTKVFGSSYLPTVETVEHVKVFTGIGVIGLWLLFVYIFSIWLVLGTLSSHQFQDQIRRDSRNIEASETQSQLNKSQTVASIVRLLDSYEIGQLSRQITNQEFQNTEERINEVSNEIDSEQVKSDKLWGQYNSTVDKTKREFIRSGGQFLESESESPDADLILTLAQRAFPDDQPLMKLVESAGDALFKWNETNDNIRRLENSLVKLKNRRKELIGSLEVLRGEENKLFRSERERSKDRWAYRVQAEIDAQGKDKNELVKFLRVPPEAIGDWLDEKQMVPEDAQDIIAAWLGRERRELFSDQGAAEIQSP